MKQSGVFGWLVSILMVVIFCWASGMSTARGATVSVGDQPLGVAAHPDGSFVFVSNAGDNTVSEIRVSDLALTRTFQVGVYPAGLVVSPDGNHIYVACNDSNRIYIIQRSDGTLTDVASGSGPWGVALDAAGDHLYVANTEENTVSIFDTGTNTQTGTIGVGAEPLGLAISGDDSTLYVANRGSDTVSVIDLSAAAVTNTISVGEEPVGLRLDNAEENLYAANFGDDTVSVVNVADLTIDRTIEVSDGPSELAVSADDRYVYVSCSNANEIAVIDIDDDDVITTRPVESYPVGIDALPDGSYYYAANFGSDSVSVLYKTLVRILSVSSEAVRSDRTVEARWSSSDAGFYRVESGGNDTPGTGDLLSEGAVAAGETVVTTISGDSLGAEEGSYLIYFYVTDTSGRTGGNNIIIRLDNTAPASPTGFEGSVGDQSIFLGWNIGAESDLDGYRVYFGTAPGQYDAPVSIENPDATSYTLGGLENEVAYYLALTALDQAGNESQPSAEIVVSPEEILGAAGLAGESEDGCFVATACFGSEDHETVRALRRLRDGFLKKDSLGRGIIRMYNTLGPGAARFISDKPTLKWAVREALSPLAYMEPFLSRKTDPFSLLALFIMSGPPVILALCFFRFRRPRRME